MKYRITLTPRWAKGGKSTYTEIEIPRSLLRAHLAGMVYQKFTDSVSATDKGRQHGANVAVKAADALLVELERTEPE